MPRLVSGKCYRGNDALVPDAALTRKSLENSPVPKETVPLESASELLIMSRTTSSSSAKRTLWIVCPSVEDTKAHL
jgi:hypothetical protein